MNATPASPTTNDSSAAGTLSLPSAVAAIEHGAQGDRLVLIGWPGGAVRALSTAGDPPRDIAFSDDGVRVSWRVGGALFVTPGGPEKGALATGLARQAQGAISFSSDGKRLWTAGDHGLLRVDTERAPGVAELPPPRLLSVGEGCRVSQLRRGPDGDSVWALCTPAPGSPHPQVVHFDAGGSRLAAREAPGASRILGLRDDGALLYARTVGAGEEIVALTARGLEVARPAVENQFVVEYLPRTRRVVVALGGEDTGDATQLQLGPLDGETRPWLAKFPRLTDLSFSRDERWAVFVERPVVDDPTRGGSLRLVPTGGDDTQLLIAATADHSYSRPLLRPDPPRPR